MSLRKPHKACDAEEQHLKFPLIAMPKMDGIRGLLMESKLYSRTLKLHPNLHCQKLFGKPEFNGLDGELILGDPTDPLQCNKVGSAVGTIKGEPDVQLYAFDYLTPETVELPYRQRLERLEEWFISCEASDGRIKLMPWCIVYSWEQAKNLYEIWLEQGFEGIILRDPEGKHKEGRSTARENGFLRMKPWVDSECIVLTLEQGQQNNNPPEKNELGHTKRSTHQENMVPNGMVGAMLVRDVYSEELIRISTGNMTEAERKFYWENPSKIVEKIGKYKCMRYGMKDKPRFAGWLGFRNKEEM